MTDEVQSLALVSFDLAETMSPFGKLVNALAGDEIFEDVLKSIRQDLNGPKLDVREFVRSLGERFLALRLPEDDSMLLAIATRDPRRVRELTDQALQKDPTAELTTVAGHSIWEVPDGTDRDDSTSIGVAVYRDHLLYCTSQRGLRHFILWAESKNGKRLASKELDAISPDGESIRCFSSIADDLLPPFRIVPVRHPGDTVWGRFLVHVGGPFGTERFRNRVQRARAVVDAPSALTVTSTNAGWEIRGLVFENSANQQFASMLDRSRRARSCRGIHARGW